MSTAPSGGAGAMLNRFVPGAAACPKRPTIWTRSLTSAYRSLVTSAGHAFAPQRIFGFVQIVVPLQYYVNAPVIQLLPHVVAAEVGVGKVAFVIRVHARGRDDWPVPVGQRTQLGVRREIVRQPVELRRVIAEVIRCPVAFAIQGDEMPVADVVGVPALPPSARATRIVACA